MMNTATKTQKKKRSNRAIWIIVIFMVIATYMCSFGPALYVFIKIDKKLGYSYSRYLLPVFITVYVPHLYFMANSDLYYEYGCRWIDWAESPPTMQSRQEFHDALYKNGPYNI